MEDESSDISLGVIARVTVIPVIPRVTVIPTAIPPQFITVVQFNRRLVRAEIAEEAHPSRLGAGNRA
jgi:hypothetical protein